MVGNGPELQSALALKNTAMRVVLPCSALTCCSIFFGSGGC
jgi:hypothetical protein